MVLPYEKFNATFIKLPFQLVETDSVEALRALYQTQRGNFSPFLLVLDVDNGPCYFGRLTNNFNTNYATLGRNNSVLEFREDPIGAFLS
jgi:hypothetical protein